MFFREKVYHHATSNRSMLEAGVFYYILTLCQACALSLPPSHIFGWGNWGTEEFSKSSVPRLGLCDQNITSSVQSLSSARLFATPWTTAYQASVGPSPTPRACSNLCPSSWWCHPTISSSVFPFSSCLLSPSSGSFLMSPFFTSGGQSIGEIGMAT